MTMTTVMYQRNTFKNWMNSVIKRHTTSSPPPNAASPRSAYDAERTLTRAAHQYRSAATERNIIQ
eukprot:2214535-Amphidinium_carterae.2